MSFAELQKLKKLSTQAGIEESAPIPYFKDGGHAEEESKLFVPRLIIEEALQQQNQEHQHLSSHLLVSEASEKEEERPILHIRSVGDIVKASRDRRKQEEAILIAKHSRSVAKIGVCIQENKPNSKISSSAYSASKGGGKTSQLAASHSELSAESFSPINRGNGAEEEDEDLSLSFPSFTLVDELSFSLFATDETWKNDTLSKCRKVLLSREALLLRTQTAIDEDGVRENALVLKSVALSLTSFTEEGSFFPPIHLLSGGSSELLLHPK